MAREKTTTLYSRNGIRITKTENIDVSDKITSNKKWTYEEICKNVILKHGDKPSNRYISNTKYVNNVAYSTIKKTSPLGFYYYVREYNTNNYGQKSNNISVNYKKHIIWLNGTKYELEYPIEYCNNDMVQRINIDMRPWDILPGYKGMPDNMINALVKEANKFINIIYEYKNTLKMSESADFIRKYIMIDLFGYEDGPKIQPNNIKILAHGFDLKESFRKRKES